MTGMEGMSNKVDKMFVLNRILVGYLYIMI